MKKKLLITLFFASCFIVYFAQTTSNLVVFSDDASSFYIFVNGVKQNNDPQTNVKITGLTNQANSILINFSDESKGSLKKDFYFQEMGVEATAKITNTKNGYKLRYFGEVPISSAQNNPNQWITPYGTNTSTNTNENPSSTNTTTIETTNTSTTETNNSININTTSSTSSNSIELNYYWIAGTNYLFSAIQTDNISTSMMGMNINDQFKTNTEFQLYINTVNQDGIANGILYLTDFKVTDSKNRIIASIHDIPGKSIKNEVQIDKKGRFIFQNKLMLITSANTNVLAYSKENQNAIEIGGQAGDIKVSAYAEFDPKTGNLKSSYKMNALNNTREVQVKVNEETDVIDVLPYDYLELLLLPEGAITQGDMTTIKSGIYNNNITVNSIDNGLAIINYKLTTNKTNDPLSGSVEMNNTMNMNTSGMNQMDGANVEGLNMMTAMSPTISCDFNNEFNYAIGMFNQVNGMMTTTMDMMGVKMKTDSTLTLKRVQ